MDSLHIVFLGEQQGRIVCHLVARLPICPLKNDEDTLPWWDRHMHLVGSHRSPYRAWVPIKHDLNPIPKDWKGVNIMCSLNPGGFIIILKDYREVLEFVEDYGLL